MNERQKVHTGTRWLIGLRMNNNEQRFGFAHKPMPSKCPDCQGKLGPVEHGHKYDKQFKLVSPSFVDGFWRACSCGCVVTWSWMPGGQGFIRRHVLPLFDDRFVLQIVDDWRHK